MTIRDSAGLRPFRGFSVCCAKSALLALLQRRLYRLTTTEARKVFREMQKRRGLRPNQTNQKKRHFLFVFRINVPRTFHFWYT